MSLIDNTIDLKQLIPNDKQDKGKLINFDGNIQQLVLNLLQEGNISGDIMAGDRNINIKRGNYNERIEGNYYEQKGNNNTMTNVTQNHSGSGDNVDGKRIGDGADTIGGRDRDRFCPDCGPGVRESCCAAVVYHCG